MSPDCLRLLRSIREYHRSGVGLVQPGWLKHQGWNPEILVELRDMGFVQCRENMRKDGDLVKGWQTTYEGEKILIKMDNHPGVLGTN